MYEGIQDRYVYILKDGIIKTSVISRDGREFNLRYITGLEIVSLLKDEYSQFIDSPFNIRIESEKAELYQIDRVQFWKDVNESEELQLLKYKHSDPECLHTLNTFSFPLLQQETFPCLNTFAIFDHPSKTPPLSLLFHLFSEKLSFFIKLIIPQNSTTFVYILCEI